MGKKRSRKKGGVVVPIGAYPEDHERETAHFLANLGHDVTFLVASRTKGVKTADIMMDGVLWEMKRLKRLGKHTVEHSFYHSKRVLVITSKVGLTMI